jgi:hypothetical protein
MFPLNRKTKITAALIMLAALPGGRVAYAAWSAGGSGGGNAKALTAQSVTVTAATGAADLFPGFTQGDVFFTMTNANPYPITFTSMTPGAITTNTPTCTIANVSVIPATSLSLNVAANATSPQLSIANVVTMVAGAPDACQGAVFTIALTLTGAQV